jgi:UDP-glucose 4-epimerase
MIKKRKKILITGGLGFLGSHLTDAFVAAGNKVVVVDRNLPSFSKPLNPKAKFYRLDVALPSLGKIFKKEKPEVVIHLTANISVPRSINDPLFDARQNIMAALNVLETARMAKVKRFIFASSGGAIYGGHRLIPTPELLSLKPLSPYGITKQAFEYYLFCAAHHFGMSTVILRMSNLYGPRQGLGGQSGVVGIFSKKIARGEPLNVFNFGRETRDNLFIDDAVLAFKTALDSKVEGLINISSGQEVSIKKIVEMLLKISGKKVPVNFLPARAKGEAMRSVLSNRLAKKKMDWQPKFSLQDGLRKTYAWYEKNKDKLDRPKS